MVNLLSHEISVGKLKDLQTRQHFNVLKAEGTVPALAAGGLLNISLNVSNEGDFFCQDITGSFTSLIAGAAPPPSNDDGVNHLRAKIRDAGSGTDLFDDYVPLDLFLSPGRTRAAGVVTAPGALTVEASNPLFVPKRFVYVFRANTNIQIEVKNDADYANSFVMAFWGIRIKSPAAVAGLKQRPKQ